MGDLTDFYSLACDLFTKVNSLLSFNRAITSHFFSSPVLRRDHEASGSFNSLQLSLLDMQSADHKSFN